MEDKEFTENDFNLMVIVSCSLLIDHYIEKTGTAEPELLAVAGALSSIKDNLSEDRLIEVVDMLNGVEDHV